MKHAYGHTDQSEDTSPPARGRGLKPKDDLVADDLRGRPPRGGVD